MKIKQFQWRTLPLTILCLLLLALPMVLSPITAYAAEQSITDEADLLSEEETKTLEASIRTFEQTTGYPLYIYTVTQTDGIPTSVYLSNQADSMQLSEGILILVNMAPGEREIKIQAYGNIQSSHYPGERLQNVTDSITSYFSRGNYAEGFEHCISKLTAYSKTSPRTDGILYQSWIQLIIALVVGGIVVLIMTVSMGGRVTTSSSTYLNTKTSRLVDHSDQYLRTTVMRTKRETNSNHGGGSGGGGTSGGGRSYSEGSSKF